jgi:hypothetical protein
MKISEQIRVRPGDAKRTTLRLAPASRGFRSDNAGKKSAEISRKRVTIRCENEP